MSQVANLSLPGSVHTHTHIFIDGQTWVSTVSADPGLTVNKYVCVCVCACDLVDLDSDIETGTVYSNQTSAEMTEKDTDFSITSSESSHQQPDDSE